MRGVPVPCAAGASTIPAVLLDLVATQGAPRLQNTISNINKAKTTKNSQCCHPWGSTARAQVLPPKGLHCSSSSVATHGAPLLELKCCHPWGSTARTQVLPTMGLHCSNSIKCCHPWGSTVRTQGNTKLGERERESDVWSPMAHATHQVPTHTQLPKLPGPSL